MSLTEREARRRLARWSISVSALVWAGLAACGTDATPGPDPTDAATLPETGLPSDAREDLDANSTVDSGPTRAPFGLEARLPNSTCRFPSRPREAAVGLTLTPVYAAAGVVQPTAMGQIPGDPSRMFFLERPGQLVSVSSPSATGKTVVATLPDPVETLGEGGALGFAFHPKFAQNGYVYFSYTRVSPTGDAAMQSLIVRMTSRDGGRTFGEPLTVLGPFDQLAVNHKGGDLHFGPDGYLYASFGDGGGAGDPFGHGQDTTGYFSKILRLDVDSASPFAIPPSNPFALSGGEKTTFAYGFRNPYRFTVDPVSGEVWAGDVGEDDWEEVDYVVPGGNYGWSVREGNHCFPPSATTCATAGLVDPVVEHPHSAVNPGPNGDAYSIILGPVYRGSRMASRVGSLLYADFSTGKIFSLRRDAQTGAPRVQRETDDTQAGLFIGFGEDLAHEVYVFDYSGAIYALSDRAARPEPSAPFPEKLSDTGCFRKSDPKEPLPFLIPYAPLAPFYSDGAEKERFMALPDGATVTVGPDGDFDFPVGTVLAKHFRFGNRWVETRLFVRHEAGPSGWGGYSYEWNADGTEATLLPAAKVAKIGAVDWTFPSRSACFSCHTEAAGRSLGLEKAQLDGDFVYPSTQRISNQLVTWEKIGVFSAPLASTPQVAKLSPPFGTDPVERRARSYLHTNCSFCHRPGGPGRGEQDLRFSTPLSATKTCGASPSFGDLGVSGAKLLDPGHPERSVLPLRMRADGAHRAARMPPPLVGPTSRVDAQGAALLESWALGLTSCPP